MNQVQASTGIGMSGWIIIIVLVLLAIFISYLNYQNAKPFRITAYAALSPALTLDTLQTQHARDQWTLGFRDDSTLIMQTDRDAHLGTTVALGCLSVWLALVHLLLSRGKITLEISVTELGEGTAIDAQGSQCGSNVLNYTAHILGELPK